MGTLAKIGFGGGCHWCTEAVFQSLKGVERVEQGWIASEGVATSFSEAVIVHFDSSRISLEVLIEIHLRTHKSTSAHSMRTKYRSAVYVFSGEQSGLVKRILEELQKEFDHRLVTKVLRFYNFKPSEGQFSNYYRKNPQKPFCQSYIDPKLNLLLKQFKKYVNEKELTHLTGASIL